MPTKSTASQFMKPVPQQQSGREELTGSHVPQRQLATPVALPVVQVPIIAHYGKRGYRTRQRRKKVVEHRRQMDSGTRPTRVARTNQMAAGTEMCRLPVQPGSEMTSVLCGLLADFKPQRKEPP